MNESVKVALQVHRRESSQFDGNDSAVVLNAFLVEHEEPETPIHPALEYEVFAAVSESASSNSGDDDSTVAATTRQEERAAQKSVKLMISFIFLVIAGSGNVVAAKLQAIPM